MSINFKEKFKLLFEKIKKIKHIKLIGAIAIALVFVLIYLSNISETSTKIQTDEVDNNRTEFATSKEYTDYLENKLESVITSLKGVGETEVVITLEKGFEYIYQTEEETKTTSNGTSLTTSTVVLVDGKPIILEEIYPVIKGIVIIAQGSSNVSVKMDILSVVQTVIDIDTSQIKIMEGK